MEGKRVGFATVSLLWCECRKEGEIAGGGRRGGARYKYQKILEGKKKKMKNEDKGKNKGKLKYIGVVVVVAFLAGIYLASATTVITDIQMTLGNVTIRPDEIQIGNTTIGGESINTTDLKAGVLDVACPSDINSHIRLDPDMHGGCNSVGILMNEYRNQNKLWISAYDQHWGNYIWSRDPTANYGQGFGIMGGDWCAPFERFVVNTDEMFLGYSVQPGDGYYPAGGGDGTGNLYVRGNVGIGTTSPQGPLQVGEGTFIVTSANKVGIGTLIPLADLHIKNGTPEVRIDATNADGFARLHLDSEGVAQLILDSNNDHIGFIQFADNWNARWRIKYNPLDEKLTFERFPYATAPPVITLTQDRNVGIGTENPEDTLHIEKDQGNVVTYAIVENANLGNPGFDTGAGIRFKNNNGDAGRLYSLSGQGGNAIILRNDQPNADIRFETSTSTPLFIKGNNDNVGIGTMNPQRALHISDVLRLEPRDSAPANPSEGDIYVNSNNHRIYCYLNGAWKPLDN